MTQKKVDDVKLKLAQLAQKELWKTLGKPGTAQCPWWLLGSRIKPAGDSYVIETIVSRGLVMDSPWPNGLPMQVGGVRLTMTRAAE